MASDDRIVYLDIAKGIGIVLMVMGHSFIWRWFDILIHGFHMPLFFFVSGLLFTFKADKRWHEVFLGKCRTILIPYAVFGLLIYGIWAVLNGGRVSGEKLLAPLGHLFWFNSSGLVISGEFWFLSAMFFASLCFDGLFRFVGKPLLRAALLVVLALFGSLFRWKFKMELPWSLLSAMVGAGFMGIAFFLRRNAEKGGFFRRLFHLRGYGIAMLVLIYGVLSWVNGPVNMRKSIYSIVPLFWFNAVVMSVVVVNVSIRLEAASRGFAALCRNYLAAVGKDSITYLCINSLVLYFLNMSYRKFIGNDPKICREAICFLLTMVILYGFNRVVMKTALRVFLGRRSLKSETGKPHAA